jgi:hypothetical protein
MRSLRLSRENILKFFIFVVAFSSPMDPDPVDSDFTKMIRVSPLDWMGRKEWYLVYTVKKG